MNWWQCSIILLVFIKFIDTQNYDILLEKMNCDIHSEYICRNATCHIRPVKRFVTNLTFECDLREELDSVLLQFTLFYKVNEYRKFLVDVQEDLCDYMVDNKRTIVMNILVPELLAKSNVNKTCPINKGPVWVRNYQVDARRMPPFLPGGQYRLDMHATNKKKTNVILSPKVFFTIRPKGLNKGEMG